MAQDTRQKSTTPRGKAGFERKKPERTVQELLEIARELEQAEAPGDASQPPSQPKSPTS